MQAIIKSSSYSLRPTGAAGREGEIYALPGTDNSKLAKVYYAEKRTPHLQRKITAIINRFRRLDLGGVENFIAFPELAVFDRERKFCGFVMKNFANHSRLIESKYDLGSATYRNPLINDEKATAIAASLFAFLEVLHQAGIILGDISPDNILLDNIDLMPVIVDLDSAQVGTFFSSTHTDEYMDPAVRVEGYGRNKHFLYTTDSDIFAMAAVCYEFLIGANPYFFQTAIPTDNDYKKQVSLSFLDYFEANEKKPQRAQFDLFNNDFADAVSERLAEVRERSSDIYAFFKSIFSEDERRYFRQRSRARYSVKPKGEGDESGTDIIDLLPQSKDDPEELDLFTKQFGLEVLV